MKFAYPPGLGVKVGSTTQVTSNSVIVNPQNTTAVQNIVKQFTEQIQTSVFETHEVVAKTVLVAPQSANALPPSQHVDTVTINGITTYINTVESSRVVFNGISAVSVDKLTRANAVQVPLNGSTYYVFGVKTCTQGEIHVVPLVQGTTSTTVMYDIALNGIQAGFTNSVSGTNLSEPEQTYVTVTGHFLVFTKIPIELSICCNCNPPVFGATIRA